MLSHDFLIKTTPSSGESVSDKPERLRHDPWRMLVATALLNKTTGRAANPIREEIFRRWPSAAALAEGESPLPNVTEPHSETSPMGDSFAGLRVTIVC